MPAACRETAWAPCAAELLWLATVADNPSEYLHAAATAILLASDAEYVAAVAAQGGTWQPVADAGKPRRLPIDLVAGAMDREQAASQAGWVVVPLPNTPATEALVVYPRKPAQAAELLAPLSDLVAVVQQGLEHLRASGRVERRLRRLENVLRITSTWNRTREVEPLLVQMAQAATELLEADRASIFLWDRPARTLVARPALGVADGQLRIPDDCGVVGRVIHSGRPCRVDSDTEPEAIDHQVDSQTGYHTRSVLCVPLRDEAGKVIGAFEVINKHSGPFTSEDEQALLELAEHAAIALENAQDREQLLATSRQLTEQAAQHVQLVGNSPAIEAIRSIVGRVADTDLAVLILGENGTGKEVVAQLIHYLSRRRLKPFVAVNCAAIPETLAESELFGHEKGAFTDAHEARAGKFELAAEGTLFLDEIADLSLACQAKLLRVLEEKLLVRVGGSAPIHTDARILAATNQDLAELVRQRRFREDLFFRLNVVTIEVPPLRERPTDVMLLANHFLEQFCRRAHRKVPAFSAAARKRLEMHSWPGNVRELRNLMERIAYLVPEDRIEAEHLEFVLAPRTEPILPVGDLPLAKATREFQVQYIRQAIRQAGGNVSKAAEHLGMHRSNLYRKMRQLGMSDDA